METDAGDWTDRTFADVQSQAPEEFAAFLAGDPSFAFPGGESFAQQEVRVGAASTRSSSIRCRRSSSVTAWSSARPSPLAQANGCPAASAFRTAR